MKSQNNSHHFGTMFPQNFSWGADNQEVDEETENPAAFQMNDDLGRQY